MEYTKPLPEITVDNGPFWEGCKRHQLLLQKCSRCGHVRCANPTCPRCWSMDHEWVPSSGRGRVYTWVVVHQRYSKAFEEDLPYNVAIVELDQGPRLLTNLVGIESSAIRPDLPVEVVWDDVTDEITLPKFKPRS
ncbi:MAG: Zn-ribbon domain-containing OB-fold protein [Dehalococcoidia bacterium]